MEGQRVSLVKPASCIIWNLRNPWAFCHEPMRGGTSAYSPLSGGKTQNEGEKRREGHGAFQKILFILPPTRRQPSLAGRFEA